MVFTRAMITGTWTHVCYRITEDSVQDEKEQKELEETKKVPSPPQRSESQDAVPIKTS